MCIQMDFQKYLRTTVQREEKSQTDRQQPSPHQSSCLEILILTEKSLLSPGHPFEFEKL